MRVGKIWIDSKAAARTWPFTQAAAPRFIAGGDTGALVCHGFTGTPANMRCIVDALANMGLTVSAPLLTGHGLTLGDMAKASYNDWQNDILDAYDGLTDAGCKRIFLCGLSMGALLSAYAAAERGCAGLVLMCPPIRMKAYLRLARTISPVAPYMLTAHGFVGDIDEELYYGMPSRKIRDLEILGKAAEKSLPSITAPVLLIRAGDDNRVADKSYTILKRGLANAKSVDMLTIDGAPHGVPYSPYKDAAAKAAASFIQKNM